MTKNALDRWEIGRDEIEAVYAPYVHRRFKPDDPEMRSILRRARREWRVKRLRHILANSWRRTRRDTETVKSNYNRIWARFDFTNLRPDKPRKLYATRWNDAFQLVNAWGIPRVHLYCLERIVEDLRPKRVLEVGAGRGFNLLALAARFPDIEFAGLELSDSGVREAKALAEADHLPEELLSFIPFELRDPGAVKRIEWHQGSAEALPFEREQFDLVFTRQALEQMEAIREAVLSEIVRVTRQHVIMFEAFRDWNSAGMHRDRAVVTRYFAARLADLNRRGLSPVATAADLPQKIYMCVGLAVAEKQARTHP